MQNQLSKNVSLCDVFYQCKTCNNSKCERRKVKQVIRETRSKYTCVGSSEKIIGTDIRQIHRAVIKLNDNQKTEIMKYFKDIDRLFTMFMDANIIPQVAVEIKLSNDAQLCIPNKRSRSTYI